MKRFKESDAKLACLCSSDKVYAGEAVNAAEALAAARRKPHLSGRQAGRSQEGLGRRRDWNIPLSRL